MEHKKGRRFSMDKIVVYFLLLVVSFMVLMPLYYLLITSFKTFQESIGAFSWLPNQVNLDNFKYVLNLPDFHLFRYFFNTMYVFVIKTSAMLLTCSLAAFGFARYNFRYKELIFLVLMSVLMIPGEILTIPFYEFYLGMNLMDTYVPLYLSGFFAADIFIIFLFRQFFVSVPSSLFEAARIDGCSEMGSFFRIMLPLSKPVIITMVLLYFSGTYNDIYTPNLYLFTEEKWVMAQGLKTIEDLFHTGSADSLVPFNYVSAATIMAIVPMFIVFFWGQKFFVEGVSTSGIKG